MKKYDITVPKHISVTNSDDQGVYTSTMHIPPELIEWMNEVNNRISEIEKELGIDHSINKAF